MGIIGPLHSCLKASSVPRMHTVWSFICPYLRLLPGMILRNYVFIWLENLRGSSTIHVKFLEYVPVIFVSLRFPYLSNCGMCCRNTQCCEPSHSFPCHGLPTVSFCLTSHVIYQLLQPTLAWFFTLSVPRFQLWVHKTSTRDEVPAIFCWIQAPVT